MGSVSLQSFDQEVLAKLLQKSDASDHSYYVNSLSDAQRAAALGTLLTLYSTPLDGTAAGLANKAKLDALKIADRAIIMKGGRVLSDGNAQALLGKQDLWNWF